MRARRGRRHAETLVPAIEFLCNQAGIEMTEFSAIAVDIGPGLFTGMRVGIAAGKAIAQALRIPMIGISSLDLLAFPLRYSDRTIAAVIDARKGEVFTAFYRTVPGGVQRVTDFDGGTDWIAAPDVPALAPAVSGGRTSVNFVGVGVGVLTYALSPASPDAVMALICWQGLVPATFTLLLGAALRRWVPHHPFVYVLGRGF